MIDQSADAGILEGDERRDFFQPFGNTVNVRHRTDSPRRTSVKKPVSSATSVRAPERAPWQGDVDAHTDAVAKQGDIREAGDQLRVRNLTLSVGEIIQIEPRCWISDLLKKLRTEEPSRSHLGTMNVTQVFWLTASNRLLACRIRCRLSSRTTRQPKWLCYSVQPIHRVQQTPKLRVAYVQRGQPFADSFAFPPRFVANWRKLIAIQPCSNVMRRRVGKGIVRQERQRAAIVMQKFPYKMQRPRIVGG